METFNMPKIEDFRKGGRFYKIKIKKTTNELPQEIYRFVFPDYNDHIFNPKIRPKKKTIEIIKNYCVSLQREVVKEERVFIQKVLKDLEVKQLEDKIREYFDNYYKNLYKPKEK